MFSVYYSLFFFFFSSRRRHTRSLRDWSSDVCSSDLGEFAFRHAGRRRNANSPAARRRSGYHAIQFSGDGPLLVSRSEERRVGKECRSRLSAYHYKKEKGVVDNANHMISQYENNTTYM